MNEKILPFIIGLLLGAILATGGFLIYSKSVGGNNQNMPQTNNGMESGGVSENPNDYGSNPREYRRTLSISIGFHVSTVEP